MVAGFRQPRNRRFTVLTVAALAARYRIILVLLAILAVAVTIAALHAGSHPAADGKAFYYHG
jgi:hypothetical protein